MSASIINHKFHMDLLENIEQIDFIKDYLNEFNLSAFEAFHPASEKNKNSQKKTLSFEPLHYYQNPLNSGSDFNQKYRTFFAHLLNNFLNHKEYYIYNLIGADNENAFKEFHFSFHTFFNYYFQALQSPLLTSFTQKEIDFLSNLYDKIERNQFPFKSLCSPYDIPIFINYVYGTLQRTYNNSQLQDEKDNIQQNLIALSSFTQNNIAIFLEKTFRTSQKNNDQFLALTGKEASVIFSHFSDTFEEKISEEREKLNIIDFSNIITIHEKIMVNDSNNLPLPERGCTINLIYNKNLDNKDFYNFLERYQDTYLSQLKRYQIINSKEKDFVIQTFSIKNKKSPITAFSFPFTLDNKEYLTQSYIDIISNHIAEIYSIHSDDTLLIHHSFTSFFNRLKSLEREQVLQSQFNNINHDKKPSNPRIKI